ncbi:GatB/YqeY domain-containing protein [Candidatus Chlorohelix sp.]|uniref:GatB/YqeY domain-containing protein n=1 Tax=Candidatus Chlorohelix sp. TaxID=3139201 RepID=UPI00305E6411
MGLKEQLQADMVAAMKGGDKARTDAVRLIKAAIQRFELDHTDSKSPLYGKPITEDDYLGVVAKEIKQRRESIEQFRKGNREDLAEKEEAEIRIFEVYLPLQLTRDEIVQLVSSIIEREGKEFKKVMPLAAKEFKGKADGKLVSEVVRELTS